MKTKEVCRAAALAGGFLEIVSKTGLPLDLHEIGAGGGLLLGRDLYRYDFGAFV